MEAGIRDEMSRSALPASSYELCVGRQSLDRNPRSCLDDVKSEKKVTARLNPSRGKRGTFSQPKVTRSPGKRHATKPHKHRSLPNLSLAGGFSRVIIYVCSGRCRDAFHHSIFAGALVMSSARRRRASSFPNSSRSPFRRFARLELLESRALLAVFNP